MFPNLPDWLNTHKVVLCNQFVGLFRANRKKKHFLPFAQCDLHNKTENNQGQKMSEENFVILGVLGIFIWFPQFSMIYYKTVFLPFQTHYCTLDAQNDWLRSIRWAQEIYFCVR